ncbi:MAG: 4Fe-4S binding protein [Bacteroidales bacterium]|nr:4Fe-4S binding protein [Bacteroidales bacterium]
MGNQKIIHIDLKKCTACYACLRVCPVKAIVVKNNQHYPEVMHNRCIGCGSCVSACPVNAISYSNSINEVKTLLKEPNNVAAIIDPAISSEFTDITDYRKFVGMIRAMGFKYVIDASFAVDLVAKKYNELLNNFKGKYYISSNCPAVVEFVEKFQPEIADNLAPIVSPMIASAKITKKLYGDNTQIVYMGPCIAAKMEAERYSGDGKVNAVITFSELRELFTIYKIEEKSLEYSDFDPPFGFKGALYPISKGIIEAAGLNQDLGRNLIITSEGKSNMLESAKAFKSDIEKIRAHFNVFYDEGCIMGPGNTNKANKYVKRSEVIKYTNKRSKLLDMVLWKKEIEKFSDIDLSAVFKPNDQRIKHPSEEKINEILKIIARDSKDQKTDCMACGYETCREFAISVAKGLAKTDMCLTYALKNRQDYIKTLTATNEKLLTAQKALEKSEKQTKLEKETAREASEITNSMLQKLRAGVLIMDKDLKIIQSNKKLIEMLGEDAKAIDEVIPGLVGADIKTLLPYNIYNLFQFVLQNNEDIHSRDMELDNNLVNVSVFAIRKGKIVGAILRDMQLPDVQKDEVVRRVTDVIDKNLEMVQKMGFILGESASETEKMLNSIIELHKSKKEN